MDLVCFYSLISSTNICQVPILSQALGQGLGISSDPDDQSSALLAIKGQWGKTDNHETMRENDRLCSSLQAKWTRQWDGDKLRSREEAFRGGLLRKVTRFSCFSCIITVLLLSPVCSFLLLHPPVGVYSSPSRPSLGAFNKSRGFNPLLYISQISISSPKSLLRAPDL